VTSAKITRKPTRGQLLRALGRCQGLFGDINTAYANDRALDRAAVVTAKCIEGFDVCVNALEFDPPQDSARRPRTQQGQRKA